MQQQEKDRFANKDITVERSGTQIVLPSAPVPMTYEEAILALQRKIQEEETDIAVNEDIDAWPFDGAYAFMKAMADIYGWSSPVPSKGFFGDDIPPNTVSVEVDFNKYTQIIWGDFRIPGIKGILSSGFRMKDGRPIFVIKGKVKKKHMPDVAALAVRTREIVKAESIYRGKPILLKTNSEGQVDFGQPPTFLDLSRVNPEELTFSEEVKTQVETNLFTLIENTSACRMHGIPLKRGVLLEGPFGTGKTLTAFVSATMCVRNDWTFVMVDRVTGLDQALAFARQYQPAVVFAEDVDRTTSGERDVDLDDVLNTIDGLQSKGTEIITVLTSNEVSNINRAMLRPGRLDAIIQVNPPDAKAAEKLVRLYSRNLIEETEDLTDAGKELNGHIPAVIREVVERAKLYAISRAGNGKISLNAADLVHSARGMKRHLDLLYPKDSGTPDSAETQLGKAFTAVIKSNGLYETATHTKKKVDELHQRVMQ